MHLITLIFNFLLQIIAIRKRGCECIVKDDTHPKGMITEPTTAESNPSISFFSAIVTIVIFLVFPNFTSKGQSFSTIAKSLPLSCILLVLTLLQNFADCECTTNETAVPSNVKFDDIIYETYKDGFVDSSYDTRYLNKIRFRYKRSSKIRSVYESGNRNVHEKSRFFNEFDNIDANNLLDTNFYGNKSWVAGNREEVVSVVDLKKQELFEGGGRGYDFRSRPWMKTRRWRRGAKDYEKGELFLEYSSSFFFETFFQC